MCRQDLVKPHLGEGLEELKRASGPVCHEPEASGPVCHEPEASVPFGQGVSKSKSWEWLLCWQFVSARLLVKTWPAVERDG